MLPSIQRPRCLQTPSESNWIYTFSWSLVVILVSLQTVCCWKECTTKDLMSLQDPCREENDALVSNVGTNHTQRLCSALNKFWLCVAQNVPQCFGNMTDIYSSLTHSPHNCQISRKDFRRMQEIIHASEKKEQTPLTIIPSPEPGSTTKANKGEDEGGYDVDGGTSQQSANKGSSARNGNFCGYLLLTLLLKISLFSVL